MRTADCGPCKVRMKSSHEGLALEGSEGNVLELPDDTALLAFKIGYPFICVALQV
jgi:hypothetical protein